MPIKYQTEPTADIKASYGPSTKDGLVDYYVRGVRVYPLHVRNPQGYVLCSFPGYCLQWVSPANLDEKKKE